VKQLTQIQYQRAEPADCIRTGKKKKNKLSLVMMQLSEKYKENLKFSLKNIRRI
jgi:hypothetical protein